MKFKSFVVLMILGSCANVQTQDNKIEAKKPIDFFVSKLAILPSKFSYDLNEQDGDDCYASDISDSLFFNTSVSIVGLLPDTTDNYKIVYLQAGDDLYPTLKVITKEGKIVDDQSISYAACAGWDCSMDSCSSSIKIVNKGSVQRYLKTVITDCDTTGSKLPNTTVTKIKRQLITVDRNGRIVFSTEQSE